MPTSQQAEKDTCVSTNRARGTHYHFVSTDSNESQEPSAPLSSLALQLFLVEEDVALHRARYCTCRLSILRWGLIPTV